MASVSKRRWTSPSGERKEAWEVRYHDPATGRHPSKSFGLKKDAEAYRRKVEREIEDGAHVIRSNSRTVAQTSAEFTADLARRAEEKQVGRGYAAQTKRALDYAIPIIGHEVHAVDQPPRDRTMGQGQQEQQQQQQNESGDTPC